MHPKAVLDEQTRIRKWAFDTDYVGPELEPAYRVVVPEVVEELAPEAL